MQTLAQQLESAFKNAIRDAFGVEADPLITPSQNEKFGDYQSNAAMGLSKVLSEKTGEKTNPRAVAEQILARLDLGELASEKPSIAGPGFINVKLGQAYVEKQTQILSQDDRLGIAPPATRQTIVIDYSAPNVAKEMHIGHLRTTVIGDTFARIFSFLGHKVIRQNHIGDWGTQFGRVILGLWYDAVATNLGQQDQLATWMQAATQLPRKSENETPDQAKLRQERLRNFLRPIVKWHNDAIEKDVHGKTFFQPYIENQFPALPRLQALYTFASSLSEAEVAREPGFIIRNPRHGDRTLGELPSFIATMVQQQHLEQNSQEGLAWRKSIESTMQACDDIYRQLNVQLGDKSIQPEPLVYGESEYRNDLSSVVSDLLATGIAEKSEGAVVIFITGFSAPLIIQKSDGGFGYATTDLAAVRYRVDELHANRVIYVVGAPQSQHLKMIFAASAKAGWSKNVLLEHAGFGSVLGEDGKILRTRAGAAVRLKDVLDEAEERAIAIVEQKNAELPAEQKKQIARAIGIGAVKYADLSKDRNSDYIFSWEKMLAMDGNTAPYLQYVHARVRSIFRKAGISGDGLSVQHLQSPQEQTLAKHILRFGEIVESVSRDLKPHVLSNYLYDLATKFSGFYENCPVLQSEEPIRSSRLALAHLTARTMAQGLDLLGIEHPEQM